MTPKTVLPGTPTDDRSDAVLELAKTAFAHARAGNVQKLSEMLGAGLPVGLRNERGDSLLMLASYHGHLEASRLLLERGANPDQLNDAGQTPLAGAAFKGNAALVTLLLDHGARVDGPGGDGRTALMFAAMFDKLDILELLLQHGADPGARDADQRTALDYARALGAWRSATRLELAPSPKA
jgi:uncharacterized protein